MAAQAQRVLIVGPAWVGDMVMSQVICSGLRADNPDIEIDVLAPRATLSLVRRMPEVTRGILLDRKHGQWGFGYRRALGARLAENGYDRAIVTPNSLKSALVPFFADIPHRVGFLGEYRYFLLNDIRLLDKRRLPLMTDRFLALIDKTGKEMTHPELLVDQDNQARFIRESGLDLSNPVVGFCPGAEFGTAKQWPEGHFAELGRRLVAEGKSVWVLGSSADGRAGAEITRDIGAGCTNLTGKTTLLDAIDLLALCESVVTNDSGLMHIAAAVGRPLTAIYGSTSPGFTPPLSNQARTVSLGLDCSPCFRRECPLGHRNCLKLLSPDLVQDSLFATGQNSHERE